MSELIERLREVNRQPETNGVGPGHGIQEDIIAPKLAVVKDWADIIGAIKQRQAGKKGKGSFMLDERNIRILKVVKESCGLNPGDLMSYLLDRFFEERPELKTELKNKLKEIQKDL